jgi:type I restriction enzyme M protein
VGVAEDQGDGLEFAERLEELNEELESLNAAALTLQDRIAVNVALLMESEDA